MKYLGKREISKIIEEINRTNGLWKESYINVPYSTRQIIRSFVKHYIACHATYKHQNFINIKYDRDGLRIFYSKNPVYESMAVVKKAEGGWGMKRIIHKKQVEMFSLVNERWRTDYEITRSEES